MIQRLLVLQSHFLTSAGLLVLRVGAGTLMLTHGTPKLLGFAEKAVTFSAPLGVGSQTSLALAVFAEFFCALLLILGAATRLVLVPLLITMVVAGLVVHGEDPFQKKELALLYCVPFLTLLIAGPGAFSVDHLLLRRK